MAPFNNKNAVKLPTNELKNEAYKQYCEHISKGYSKKCWYFDHPDITLTWETMEKYIKLDEAVFDPIHKKVAECKSLKHWETVLAESATGKNRYANPASLQMIMRNKFGWDRHDNQHNEDASDVTINHEKLMAQIAASQTKSPEQFHSITPIAS